MNLLTRIKGLRGPRPDERERPDLARAVAIIMDGSGRWAAKRGLPVAEGHRAGSRALRPVVETAIDLGLESLAVYAFSTENWTRSEEEIRALMDIFAETIERELPDLVDQGVRVRFIGRQDRAPEDLLARPDVVHVGGVEQRDPGIDGTVHHAMALRLVGVAPPPEHHRAERERAADQWVHASPAWRWNTRLSQ